MNVPLQGLLASLDRATRLGDVVRFATTTRGLEVTAVGADCRLASYCEADGELPTCYVHAAPITKALQTRPADRPAELSCKDDVLVIRHAEYKARLPLLARQTFEMVWAGGDQRWGGAGLVEHLDDVASIVDRNERFGVLFDWHDGAVNLVGRAGSRQFHHTSWAVSTHEDGRYCMSRGAADHVVRLGEVASWWAAGGSLYFEAADAFLRVSPMRDSYPRDYMEIARAEQFMLTCEFRREHLEAAVRAADAVLSKNDIAIVMKVARQASDPSGMPGAFVEILTQNGSTHATASETIFGAASVVVPWEGRMHGRDLLNSIKRCTDETIAIDFGRKLVRLRSTKLHAYLWLHG